MYKTTALVGIEHDADTEDDSSTSKRKRSDGDVEIMEPQAKRQCFFVSRGAIPPAKTRSLIAEYVIEDMLPLPRLNHQHLES